MHGCDFLAAKLAYHQRRVRWVWTIELILSVTERKLWPGAR